MARRASCIATLRALGLAAALAGAGVLAGCQPRPQPPPPRSEVTRPVDVAEAARAVRDAAERRAHLRADMARLRAAEADRKRAAEEQRKREAVRQVETARRQAEAEARRRAEEKERRRAEEERQQQAAAQTTEESKLDTIKTAEQPFPNLPEPGAAEYWAMVAELGYDPYDYYANTVALADESDIIEPAAGTEGPSPVYNVVIEEDEILGRDPLILKPEHRTPVTFRIGPQLAESVISAVPVDVERISELAPDNVVDVNVSLDCLVCAERTYFRETVAFDLVAGSSTDAVFPILPSPDAVGGPGGLGELIFTIDISGIDLAVLRVPAFVGTPQADAAAQIRGVPVFAFDIPSYDNDAVPDLVIDVADGAGGWLPVTLIPENPALRQALADRLGRDAPHWTFESGLTKADLEDRDISLYKTLRTVVDQTQASLQRAYDYIGEDTRLSRSAAALHFSPADERAVLDALRREGRLLYKRLFRDGDPPLRRAMAVVEAFHADPERPLRIKIRATNVYAPWQLLYGGPSEGPTNAAAFWGFKFELGTLQKVSKAQGPIRHFMPAPDRDDVLFAAWRGDDAVGKRADYLRQHLVNAFGNAVDVADGRESFLGALAAHKDEVKLVVLYGHATSGTVLNDGGAASDEVLALPPTVAQDWLGERFLFAPDDQMVPEQIERLIPDDVYDDEENPVFLKSHPIVVLNACETGTGGTEPLNNNGFIGSLLRAGAGAVFVTEAPVWRNFAFHFGRDLVDEIHAGHPMSAALHAVRLRHLELQGNPLGLFYSLYGNPTLRMEVSAEPANQP
jgi:hypothetical protein